MAKSFFIIIAFFVAIGICAQEPRGVNLVFIGNSVTFGATLKDRAAQAPPAIVVEKMKQRGTIGEIRMSNLGVCGATTVDWLPGGKMFQSAIDVADKWVDNKSPLIFIITLGTNDSADEGTTGAPVSNEDFKNNLCTIIDSLLSRYPSSSIVLNHPLWYSPNTYNGARYLESGLKRLKGYCSIIDELVNNHFRAHDKGQIYLGATDIWDRFSSRAEELFTPEHGKAGVFRLHPNANGAKLLGQLWEERIYDVWRHEAPEKIILSSGATLLLYRCQSVKAKRAIIVCPGGGYEFLASGHEGTRMAHWFSDNEMTAVVLLYRMPNGDKTIPLKDASEAISLMRRNASQWGNYEKIGIMGSSAGGHLASTVATHFKGKEGVDFHILLYPVVTMEQGITHQGSRDNLLGKSPSADDVTLYSNEKQVTKNTSPAFIFLSSNDDLVSPVNTLKYVRALSENGVPFSLHMYPIGGHGWGWSDGFPYKEQWQSELLKWLEQNF